MPPLDKQSDQISTRDEANLSWFFGPGATQFEKSTFGIMLERATQFGQHAEACDTCAGLGFVELTAEQMVDRAGEFAALAAARKADDADESRSDEEAARLRELRDDEYKSICGQANCPECDGKRLTVSRILLREGTAFSCTSVCRKCHGSQRLASGDPCPRCDAMGYIEPVSANKGPLKADEEGWCPDDEALVRYALVSRRLDRVGESTFEVLRLFYGDRGTRWAGTIQGRIMVLYHLTPAGGKLAARGITAKMREALGELGLRLDEAIWNECEAQRQKPSDKRKSQIDSAHLQALRLLGAASVEWNATGPELKSEPRATTPMAPAELAVA